MDAQRFWNIIDKGARAGVQASLLRRLLRRATMDQERQLDAIMQELRSLSPEELAGFKARLEEQMERAHNWDLWGAAYVMCGGCSDDGFEYFRAWLVGQGQQVFEKVIADPDALADLPVNEPDMECEFESLLYAPAEIYEEKTGGDLYERLPGRSGASGPRGEPFDEEEVFERWPRIAAKWSDR